MRNTISHSIKIHRGYARANVGRYLATREAMQSYIPASVLDSITGAQLGELLDSIWAATERAKDIAIKDAINEGSVWDAARGVGRKIETDRN